MPTVRGWAALGAAAALGVLWIGFGERLLLAVGLFLAAAVVVGMVYVRRSAPLIRVSREVNPPQLHEGDRALVEVTLIATKRLRHVAVEDDVVGLGSAQFLADRVEPNEPLAGRYEVLCRPRGVYAVGPARVMLRDALGFSEAGGVIGVSNRLVVYPAVEDIEGMPIIRGQDPSVSTARPNFAHTGGEDFFTLREYQHGDDMRRVHWPTSAKRDQLMIKQLEMPWQSRALVVVDHRVTPYPTDESFEQAVRGAATIIRHLYANGFSPALFPGASTVNSTESYSVAMESLATIDRQDSFDLRALVTRLRRSGLGGGVLVMVTGEADEANLAAYRTLTRDFLHTVIMAVAQQPNDAILRLQQSPAVTVITGPGAKWAPAWQEAMERTWSTATAG